MDKIFMNASSFVDISKFNNSCNPWDEFAPCCCTSREITNFFSENTTSTSKDYVKTSITEKENKNTMNTNFLNNMFGRVADGMCRMSMNGDMAIKTSSGYKTYDVKSGTLTNCNNFVFDVGSEFFFIIPTNKVETGDVILAAGKPHCVIKVESNRIEALRYEDGNIVIIVPERTVFCGRTYFYGKIVSMFGNVKGKGVNKMMKYMILSEMMKGQNGNMSSVVPMMMLMGDNSGNMFENMFDVDDNEEEENGDDEAEG